MGDDLVADLVGAVHDVDAGVGSAELERGVVGHDRLDGVGRHDGDDVTADHAVLGEGVRQLVDLGVQLRVGHRAMRAVGAVGDERRAVGDVDRMPAQLVPDGRSPERAAVDLGQLDHFDQLLVLDLRRDTNAR